MKHGGAATAVALALVLVGGGACGDDDKALAEGNVYDSRTGEPVAGATVALGKSTTTAADDGHFSVTGRGSQVRVTAPNYEGATAAIGEQVRVDLAPVPVHGVVTSAFSGRGVRATVSASGNLEYSDVQGTFTMYRVGPGDELTVKALGYQARTVPIAADRTVKVELELGVVDPEELFQAASVSGFRYASLPPESIARDREQYLAVNPSSAPRVKNYGLKSAVKDLVAVAVVRVVSFDPVVLAIPNFFATNEISGCTAEKSNRQDTDIYSCRSGDLFTEVFQKLGARISVSGRDESVTRQVSTAMISAFA